MQCTLFGTRAGVGTVALFDCSLAEGVEFTSLDSLADWVATQAESGGLFRYDLGSTRDCNVRCFVEKKAPVELREQFSRGSDEVLLRVPTGRLCLAPVDAIAESFSDYRDCADIPPGDYSIRAWLVETPSDLPEEAAPARSPAVRYLICAGIAVLSAIGIYAASSSLLHGIVGGVAWGVGAALLWHYFWAEPAWLTEVKTKLEEMEARPPDLVVEMHLVEDPDGMVGGGISG